VEPVVHFLLKPFDSGNNEWTDDSMAELEKELGLALEKQQVKLSLAGILTFLSPCLVEVPKIEI